MKDKIFTTHDIAKYCSVSSRTVVQWINEGKLEAFRTPGNHSRIEERNFIKFLHKYNMPIPSELKSIKTENYRKKILIVDDDKNMALSIKRILALEGKYDLEHAYDGFDAGRKVAVLKPDLVILDIKMPGMDGFAVTKRIKELPELSHTKIIAISAFFDEEGKEKVISFGADLCLDKPFRKEELLKNINKLI